MRRWPVTTMARTAPRRHDDSRPGHGYRSVNTFVPVVREQLKSRKRPRRSGARGTRARFATPPPGRKRVPLNRNRGRAGACAVLPARPPWPATDNNNRLGRRRRRLILVETRRREKPRLRVPAASKSPFGRPGESTTPVYRPSPGIGVRFVPAESAIDVSKTVRSTANGLLDIPDGQRRLANKRRIRLAAAKPTTYLSRTVLADANS